MAYELNQKIRDLKPYDPIQGTYQIRLDANESYFNLPESFWNEIDARIHATAFNRYPDPMAREVCAGFASYYGVNPDLVTAWNGSDESISVIMTSFLMRGDKVITLSEDFSMYRFYAFLAEAELVEVQKREDLTIDYFLQSLQPNFPRLKTRRGAAPDSVGGCAGCVGRSLYGFLGSILVGQSE